MRMKARRYRLLHKRAAKKAARKPPSKIGKIAVRVNRRSRARFSGDVTITAKTRAEKHASSYASAPFTPQPGEDLWDAGRRTLGVERREVKAIKIGRRHRQDYGDLNRLARSIDARGLLQPIVITPQNKLIAGERRLRAWALSKYRAQAIPVHVVDVDSIVAGEWDENAIRKNFTPSEAVAIKRELEPAFKAAAKVRQGRKGSAAGKAGDQVASYVGKDRRTLDKAEAVVRAAEDNPSRFGKIKADMDRTGRVDGPFKRLRNIQQAEAIKKSPAPLPGRGPYQAVVIDPPWPQEAEADQQAIDAKGRSLRPYPAMSIQALCAFMADEVKPILAENCALGLWVTNHHMRHAFALLHALGIDQHSTIVTWVKDKFGRGQVRRDKTEHCIIGLLGKPVLTLTNQTTELAAARRENSQKPDEFYAQFAAVHPAPRYAEIFSRGGRGPKWDCHGDQAGKFDKPGKAAGARARKHKAKYPWPLDEQGNGWPAQNGHLVSMTRALGVSCEVNVATCQCGASWERPLGEHGPLDKAIDRHWIKEFERAMASLGARPLESALAIELPAREVAPADARAGDPEHLAIPGFLQRPQASPPPK